MPSIGRALARRRLSIAVAFVLVLGIVATATMLWPESYTSTTTILIQRQRADPGVTSALATLDRLGRGSVIETETELIKSRRVLGRVVDSLDLHVDVRLGERRLRPDEIFPAFDAGPDVVGPRSYRVSWRTGRGFVIEDAETSVAVGAAPAGAWITLGGLRARLPHEPPAEPIEIDVRPLGAVAGGLPHGAVEVGAVNREGDLMKVACRDADPDLARRMCDMIAAEYVALRAELLRTDASSTADFLRAQVERLSDSLATAEAKLEDFKQRRQVVSLPDQATEEVRQYAQLKAQRDLMEAERSALAGVVGRIEAAPGGARRYRDLASFPSFLANPTVGSLVTQLATLENQRADLARRRTEQNPELVALDTRIAELDHQVGSIGREYLQSLRAQVTSLDQALGGSAGRLSTFPERQVEAARLEREVASLSGIYGMLETRLREAEVAESVNQPPARVLDTATVPLHPSSPNVMLNMVLGVVLGLGLGIAVALIREYADSRIHDRRGLAARTALPVLAMVPRVRHPGPVLSFGPAGNGDPVAHLHRGPGAPPVSRRAWLARSRNGKRGHSAVALEVFRSLGADMQFVARRLPRGDLRSVAVTSAGPGEGKTYVAANLAIARASYGVQTLLIDGDMRNGDVAPFFGIERASPGLSELLAGRATAREARRAVRLQGGELLSILPAGEGTPDAAELLGTSYFEAMLAGAQAVYDLVVIDTPPLHVLADAAAVVASVDAVLVVVRENVTDGQSLELTLERLERAGGNVLGVVFNDVRLPKRFAGYEVFEHAV